MPIKDPRRVLGAAERKLQRDKRMHLVDRAAPSTLFILRLLLSYSPLLSLFLSFVSFSFTHSFSALSYPRRDRGRNYYFLTSTNDLSSNDLSIESLVGKHRTSANGTANGCVLLVPLHLPHYTQFSAGDLIGCSLLSFFSSSFSSPSCLVSSFFFCYLFVSCGTTRSIDRRTPFRSVALQNFFPANNDNLISR